MIVICQSQKAKINIVRFPVVKLDYLSGGMAAAWKKPKSTEYQYPGKGIASVKLENKFQSQIVTIKTNNVRESWSTTWLKSIMGTDFNTKSNNIKHIYTYNHSFLVPPINHSLRNWNISDFDQMNYLRLSLSIMPFERRYELFENIIKPQLHDPASYCHTHNAFLLKDDCDAVALGVLLRLSI